MSEPVDKARLENMRHVLFEEFDPLTVPAQQDLLLEEDRMDRIEDVEFYSVGIVHMSVCVPAAMTGEQVAECANAAHPTGVGPWAVTEEAFRTGKPNPTPCNDNTKGRRHWLLTC